MNCISRDKDVVLGKVDLEDLYTIKDFPVFMGCVDSEADQDVKSGITFRCSLCDVSWLWNCRRYLETTP